MKILVDEMPEKPSECVFAEVGTSYKSRQGVVCLISGKECEYVSACNYLKVQEKQDYVVKVSNLG